MCVIRNISTILISILMFGSCQVEIEKSELESVVSVVLNDLYKPVDPPPPPYPNTFKIDSITNDYTVKGRWSSKKDSVKYFKELEKIGKKRNIKDSIFIKTDINYFNIEIKNNQCKQYRFAYHKENDQSKKQIYIANLNIVDKNTIILPLSLRNQFKGYYPILEFSNVYFNKKGNKSIIMGSLSRGKLNSISILFYLEKIDGAWKIICKDGIAIS